VRKEGGLSSRNLTGAIVSIAHSVPDGGERARARIATALEGALPQRNVIQADGLILEKYGQMLASYPRVLEAQRKLYDLQIEYIAALESVWTNGIALQGYLLPDGLEAPARPGEVDRPVRETNVAMPQRTIAPGKTVRRNP
jgi:hypothetical protein